MRKNYMLWLCYDGTRTRGWQRQGNTDNTIQARLEALLSRILDQPVEIAGAGRTDAGVHARRQCCSFRADTERSCSFMLTELRKYLPEDIGAISLEEAPERFHARLSAAEKTYVYRVWNSDAPNVFERKYVYVWPGRLDLEEMRRAAALLTGTHDFSAFCTAKGKKKSAVRTLYALDIEEDGGELRFTLRGDGFLYNMVRILVGTLLEVGSGQRGAESVREALERGERSLAGFTAPARGLTLWDIKYQRMD